MNSKNPKKPLILVIPDWEKAGSGGIFTIKGDYLKAIEEAGGIPIISSYLEKSWHGLGNLVSGVLITGGDFDIHPRYYREEPIPETGRIKPERTECEIGVIKWALKRDLPVLGICGGMQLINVVFRGSLYQHLPRQFPGAYHHLRKKGGERKHPVLVEKKSRLFGIVGKRTLTVNSTHHQAVKVVGPGLEECAHSPDGVVEAIESVSHAFVIGVQWHPERLIENINQKRIFSAFVRAARESGAGS